MHGLYPFRILCRQCCNDRGPITTQNCECFQICLWCHVKWRVSIKASLWSLKPEKWMPTPPPGSEPAMVSIARVLRSLCAGKEDIVVVSMAKDTPRIHWGKEERLILGMVLAKCWTRRYDSTVSHWSEMRHDDADRHGYSWFQLHGWGFVMSIRGDLRRRVHEQNKKQKAGL